MQVVEESSVQASDIFTMGCTQMKEKTFSKQMIRQMKVIRQMITSIAPDLTQLTQSRPSTYGLELQCLTSILEGNTKNQITCSC